MQEVGNLTQGGSSGPQTVLQGRIVAPDIATHVQEARLPHRVVFQRAHFLKGEQLAFQEQLQHPVGKQIVRAQRGLVQRS